MQVNCSVLRKIVTLSAVTDVMFSSSVPSVLFAYMKEVSNMKSSSVVPLTASGVSVTE
jgi:hypothetical protein